MNRTATVLAGLLVVSAAIGCRKAQPADPAFVQQENDWRAARLARLRAEDGWLTLVGLHWLKPGVNRFGSDPAADVVLPGVGRELGTFQVAEDGTVRVRCAPGCEVTLDGAPLTQRTLRTDADGKPDVLRVGRLAFYVIRRADRLAVRVKDPQAPTRTGFRGLDYWPPNPEVRVRGMLERYAEPEEVAVPTVIGTDEAMLVPGVVRFTLAGRELTLRPLISRPDDRELFFVFRDATSGKETYGAGRFLDAELGDGGAVVLDFNRAYNPPCAFTPYATCPLPIPGNELPVPVRAGEKVYAGGHH